MKQINKEYTQSFLLEPTKLRRIVDKIHERLDDHGDLTSHDHFEVFLSGNRREEISSIDEVLALENSRNHKIERLLITCIGARGLATRPEHEINVDFGVIKTTPSFTGANTTRILTVTVRSDAAGWATRTMSEVEEQVERTWQRNSQPLSILVAILIVASVFFILNFVRLDPSSPSYNGSMWLTDANLARVDEIIDQGRHITDEEIREVYTMQLKNVLEDRRPKTTPPKAFKRNLIVFGIPFIVIIGCAIVLFTTYPHQVFLWGDEIDRYSNLLRRRKIAWNVIIGLMVIGVAANLFTAGFTQWIPSE
ncbi:MAG: hypothetical protein ACKVQW_04300 [Pyrinomonadaceae bacterium]